MCVGTCTCMCNSLLSLNVCTCTCTCTCTRFFFLPLPLPLPLPLMYTSQVAYVGEDAETIPVEVVQRYKKTARRLDLSYNRLKSLAGVEQFSCLEELVLDNNELTDSSLSLPLLPRLHTLTLNKNHVSPHHLPIIHLASLHSHVQSCICV